MLHLLAVLSLVMGALAREAFIIGGADVDIGDFPWQGSYRTDFGSHTCGCVFIGGTWALTAAHCGGDSSYSMLFGTSLRTDEEAGTLITVSSVTAHPNYGQGPGLYPNDIAVIEAESEISGSNVAPATMSSVRHEGGEEAWITGWGAQFTGGPLPTTLKGVEIPVLSDTECAGFWTGGDYNPDAHLCVNDLEGQDKGACNGDSGGPMTTGNTLHGITSWGPTGCFATMPSVYTRVSTYQEWACGETNNQAEGCTA